MAYEANSPNAQLQSHLNDGDYGRAVALAERIVADLDNGSDSQSYRRAVAIHNLAVAQQLTQNLDQSEQNYKRSIAMIEATRGMYSPLMVPGLNQLAKMCYRAKRLSESLQLLRRSQHIIQRSEGVYSLDQLETLNWISRVLVASSESLKADVQERFHYRIYQENFGESDARTLPALARLGEWLQNSGQYREALRVNRKAIGVIERDDAVSALQVLPFLQEISSTLHLLGVCCPVKPLKRAVDIIVSEPGSDPEDEAKAMIRLADMHLLKAHSRKARKFYGEAWKRLLAAGSTGSIGTDPSPMDFSDPSPLGLVAADAVSDAFQRAKSSGAPRGLATDITPVWSRDTQSAATPSVDSPGRVLIGSPLPLCYSHVVNLVPRMSRQEISSYYMDLDFSVNADGRVVAVKVGDSNTPWRLMSYVKSLLRSVRYRPRMANGEPLTTDHLEMRQTFGATKPGNAREFNASATIRGCSVLAAIY